MGDLLSLGEDSLAAGLISGFITTTGIVIVVGLIILIVIAVTIGMSMDTEAQRRTAQAAAEETRQCNEACRKLEDLRRAIRAERQKLAKQHEALNKCLTCPFRSDR
jgi:hypothetical protein